MSLKQQNGAPFRVNSFFPLSGQTWDQTFWQSGSAMPIYYDRLDRVYTLSTPTTNRKIGLDPTMFDNTFPATVVSAAVIPETGTNFAVGEWDKVGNTQLLYAAPNSGSIPMEELLSSGANPDLSIADSSPFAAALNVFTSPGSSALIGARSGSTGVTGCPAGLAAGNLHIFESAGYALQACIGVRHTDNVFYCNVLCQIDLTTGRSDPGEGNGEGRIVPDIPLEYTSLPTLFQVPPIFGDEITFDSIQFVADGDSVLATPKGVLYFSTGSFFNAGLTTGNVRKIYVKVVEWNPTGLAAAPGFPTRVQARELLFSRFTVLLNTEPESGGLGSSFGAGSGDTRAVFHPPTQTFRVYAHDSVGADEVMDVYELAANFSALSTPTAETTIETGKVATFSSNAAGDLGEPIFLRNVDWDLDRASSVKEALDTVGLPATSTLANPPVDDDGSGLFQIIDNDGNTLVSGAGPGGDFVIVFSTGVITWQTGPSGAHPKAESGYTATYPHKTNPVKPPHGTLLNTRSKADANGKAIARVQYPADDDLVGATDRITSTDAG